MTVIIMTQTIPILRTNSLTKMTMRNVIMGRIVVPITLFVCIILYITNTEQALRRIYIDPFVLEKTSRSTKTKRTTEPQTVGDKHINDESRTPLLRQDAEIKSTSSSSIVSTDDDSNNNGNEAIDATFPPSKAPTPNHHHWDTAHPAAHTSTIATQQQSTKMVELSPFRPLPEDKNESRQILSNYNQTLEINRNIKRVVIFIGRLYSNMLMKEIHIVE